MARADILARLGLDSTGFDRGLQRSKKSGRAFGRDLKRTFLSIGAAFGGITLVKGIANLGTAAAETASKFRAVFGPAADMMNEKVKELQQTIPATRAEMQGSLATFAQMAKAFGLNEDAASQFSVEMVRIAGDIASFNDLPIEEAFTKIRSAISGEFEPMKALGIVINEARLKQEGLNLAIWDGTGQMSAAQKALAVQSILIRDMGDANGDAALTANSAANQIKFLRAELLDTGTEIGTTVLPALSKLVEWTGAFVKGVKGASEAFGEFAGKLAFGDPEKMQAIMDLADEGITRGEGTGPASMARFNRLVNERIELNRELAEEQKKQAAAKKAADNEALKGAKDLQGELQKQIEAETDPARKKALEDRLEAHRKLIEAAGKLNSLQGVKPQGSSAGKADSKPMGMNIERGEFEGRSDYLLRREAARKAYIQLEEERRRVAAGGSTPDAAKISGLKAVAQGKESANTMLKAAQDTAESTKTIAKAVTGT